MVLTSALFSTSDKTFPSATAAFAKGSFCYGYRTCENLHLEGVVFLNRTRALTQTCCRARILPSFLAASPGTQIHSKDPRQSPVRLQLRKSKRSGIARSSFLMVLQNEGKSVVNFNLLESTRNTAKSAAVPSEKLESNCPGSSLRRPGLEREPKEQSDVLRDIHRLLLERKWVQETKFLPDRHELQPAFSTSWKNSFLGKFKNSSQSLEAAPLAPLPLFTGTLITTVGFLLIIGVALERWARYLRQGRRILNTVNKEQTFNSIQAQAPTGISVFLERDLKKKESVEWVNMVLGKLFKIYRIGLESWLVGLLQPLIDNLKKPNYVERVQIKQFFLGEEPLSVRSVERRTSRRVNDLQYHIGLRYTGGARMLLLLKLKFGFVPVVIPVGVRALDVDGEVWVKLRLVPSEPYVGSATWAFVSLPKIKLDLAPFRLFNIMAIPFLSIFLTKLLTRDLPQLFVRPNKNVIDFLHGKGIGPVPKDFKGPTSNRDNEGDTKFSGELSVTLIEARKLSYIFYGKTDPYVVLILGDQLIRSKKNSQTSVIGPPGAPIWNQDIQLLVVDPESQRLAVQIRDSFGFTTFTVGTGEVELGRLQDTVPTDRVVTLRGGWDPFGKGFAGEVLLRLTYKAYVEDEEEDEEDRPLGSPLTGAGPDSEDKLDTFSSVPRLEKKATKYVPAQESIVDMFAAVLTEFGDEGYEKGFPSTLGTPKSGESDLNVQGNDTVDSETGSGTGTNLWRDDQAPSQTPSDKTLLLWLGLVTATAVLVALSLDFSNLLNP